MALLDTCTPCILRAVCAWMWTGDPTGMPAPSHRLHTDYPTVPSASAATWPLLERRRLWCPVPMALKPGVLNSAGGCQVERTCDGRVRCYCFRLYCAWFTWLSFLRRCCGWRTCLLFLRRFCIWCSGFLFPWWIWCALCLVVPLSILITWLLDSHAVQIRSLNIRLLFALFVSNVLHDGLQTAQNRIAGLYMTLQTFPGTCWPTVL